MITLEKTEVMGWEHAIRGMRNPMNSWERSDSSTVCGDQVCTIMSDCDLCCDIPHFEVGKNDLELMTKLAKGGPVHGKYRRMITVYVDITAPLYWWKEFDTYKVGTVANSCSTMHKIHAKEFTLDDFSHEHLYLPGTTSSIKMSINNECDIHFDAHTCLDVIICVLNIYRDYYNGETDPEKKKMHWWQMIQLLPSSYNQKRTIMLNYEVLAGIYQYRRDHKLDEWREFCLWIEGLPYSEIITCGSVEVE